MRKNIILAAALAIAVFSGCSAGNTAKQDNGIAEELETRQSHREDEADDNVSFLPGMADGANDEEDAIEDENTDLKTINNKEMDIVLSENRQETPAPEQETDSIADTDADLNPVGFDYGTEGGKASGGEWVETDKGSMYLMEDGSYARNAWIGQDYADCRGILLLNAMEHIFEKEDDGSAGGLVISPSWEYPESGILDPEEWVGKYLNNGCSITVIAGDEFGITYESVSYGEEGWYTVSNSASWLDGSHCIAYRHYYNSSGDYLGDEFLTWHGDAVIIRGNEFSNGTYIKEDDAKIYEPVCGIYTENNLNRYDENGDKEVAYAYYNEESGNLQITYAVEHIVSDADGYTTYITWQGGYEGPLSEDNHYAIGYKADIISPDEYEFVFTTPECIEVYKNGDYLETLYGYSLYTVY